MTCRRTGWAEDSRCSPWAQTAGSTSTSAMSTQFRICKVPSWWMAWINRREDKMFSFDLESEKLTVIPFLMATSGYAPRSLVELEGSFSFTFTRDGVEIKVMDAASRVWVKKYGRVHLYCMVSPRNLDSVVAAAPLPREASAGEIIGTSVLA